VELEQLRVEVPDPVTLVGLRVHVSPVAGDIVDARDTTPLNPFCAVTVIVDDPDPGEAKVKLVGLAAMVKSWTVTVTVAEWDSVPLVPVTVTVKVAAVVPVHARVDVWVAPRTMLVGDRVHVRPAGDTVDASATVPVKPLTGATVIVEVAVARERIVAVVGLAATV
jgi:hypothetical protein